MIIKYPTGLYYNSIPKGTEPGNVTFVISNNPPPRTNLLFPKLPSGIARKRITRKDGISWRRETVSDLVFSVSSSTRTVEGSNNKVFEIGQVLEFGDSISKTVDPMLIGLVTTTQHDINRINYNSLNVDDADEQAINSASLVAYRSLQTKLNEAIQRRKDAEQLVVEYQKVINDSTRAIEALKIMVDQGDATANDLHVIISKLETRRDDAFRDRDVAIMSANDAAAESVQMSDKLRTISAVLK
jgi:hypothetical protein